MKIPTILVVLVLFIGLAVSAYHLIEAQGVSAQTQETGDHSRDTTTWFLATRSVY